LHFFISQNYKILQVFHVVHFECPAQLEAKEEKEEAAASADEGPSELSSVPQDTSVSDESDHEEAKETSDSTEK